MLPGDWYWLPAGMVKRCQLSWCHLNAKPRQQLQGDGDVGLGDQLAHHFNVYDGGLLGHQRQRHEQRGEELAGHIAAHLDGLQCQRQALRRLCAMRSGG
jgi:hypothetical protein